MLHTREVKLIQLAISVLFLALITACASNPPLFDAAIAGDTKAMQALLDKGADINMRVESQGGTVLMFAANRGNETAVQFLLDKGADVNLKSDLGSTALMAVNVSGNINIAYALIAKGADVNARDN